MMQPHPMRSAGELTGQATTTPLADCMEHLAMGHQTRCEHLLKAAPTRQCVHTLTPLSQSSAQSLGRIAGQCHHHHAHLEELLGQSKSPVDVTVALMNL